MAVNALPLLLLAGAAFLVMRSDEEEEGFPGLELVDEYEGRLVWVAARGPAEAPFKQAIDEAIVAHPDVGFIWADSAISEALFSKRPDEDIAYVTSTGGDRYLQSVSEIPEALSEAIASVSE